MCEKNDLDQSDGSIFKEILFIIMGNSFCCIYAIQLHAFNYLPNKQVQLSYDAQPSR